MELFKDKSEIAEYNLVNRSNQALPNYPLEDKELYFEVYISQEKLVCIIGKIDNNYIAWCSITKLSNKDTNKEIFDYITNNSFDVFSREHLVLGTERYNEIKNWYKCDIVRPANEEMRWQTPFGHYYGDNIGNHGNYFATDLVHFYEELVEKCTFRSEEEAYKNILNHYLFLLTDSDSYSKIKPLISILENESYLRLSPNKIVRDLYLECMKESSSLYNRHMSEVR